MAASVFINLTDSGAEASSLIPTADNTFDLGSATFQWRSAYLGTSLVLASAATITWSDLILSRDAAATLQLGADAAGVTDQVIKGPDRITSDGAGGNLTLAGGKNLGATAGGSVVIQASGTAATGVAGTLTTVGTWAVPSGAATTSNFLNITGTITPVSASTRAVSWQITTAGSASQNALAATMDLLAGYTGANLTNTLNLTNNVAGTGAAGWTGGAANYGSNITSNGSTAGHKIAQLGTAAASSTLNLGIYGRAVSATNTPGLNVGIAAQALNATVNVAGFFGLLATAPTLGATAALIADNGAVAADIAQFRDNGTIVASVKDGGTFDAIAYQTAGNPVGYTVSAYGVGTAYGFTDTSAAIDFGTTDPAIALDKAGTYRITGQINLAYTGATVTTETATIKVRRTNNTAADLSAVLVLDLPVSTLLTNTYGIFEIPPFNYTTTATDDAITLFGNVSAGLGAGTIDATAVGTSIVATRLS